MRAYSLYFEFITGVTFGFEHVSFTEVDREGDGWILVIHLGILRILLESEQL